MTEEVLCRNGYYWFNGRPVKGSLFNARVPIGFIARLPGEHRFYNDDIQKGSGTAISSYYFTDTSQICFLVADQTQKGLSDDGYIKVELLQRAKRWQILITQNDGVNTSQNIPIWAHVAVQTEILTDNAKAREMEILFGKFRILARLYEYKWLVTNSQKIVGLLNEALNETFKRWQEVNEDLYAISQLCETRVSGVVVKTLVDKESERLKNFRLDVDEAEQQLNAGDDHLVVWQDNFRAKLVQYLVTLQTDLYSFCQIRLDNVNNEIDASGKLPNSPSTIVTVTSLGNEFNKHLEAIDNNNTSAVVESVKETLSAVNTHLDSAFGKIKQDMNDLHENVRAFIKEGENLRGRNTP